MVWRSGTKIGLLGQQRVRIMFRSALRLRHLRISSKLPRNCTLPCSLISTTRFHGPCLSVSLLVFYNIFAKKSHRDHSTCIPIENMLPLSPLLSSCFSSQGHRTTFHKKYDTETNRTSNIHNDLPHNTSWQSLSSVGELFIQ